MGSETAPVQRAKQTRGWNCWRENFELMSCLSSPDLFHNAVDRMVSNHCSWKKNIFYQLKDQNLDKNEKSPTFLDEIIDEFTTLYS